jgi:hypothetical protein
MSLSSASAFVDSNPQKRMDNLGGVSRKVLISQIRETMSKLGPFRFKPTSTRPPTSSTCFRGHRIGVSRVVHYQWKFSTSIKSLPTWSI